MQLRALALRLPWPRRTEEQEQVCLPCRRPGPQRTLLYLRPSKGVSEGGDEVLDMCVLLRMHGLRPPKARLAPQNFVKITEIPLDCDAEAVKAYSIFFYLLLPCHYSGLSRSSLHLHLRNLP